MRPVMAEPEFAIVVSRFGPEGARFAFERLIALLVRLEHGTSRQIEARRGDGGLDVITGSTAAVADVWQAKFFHPRFTREHRRQVTSSLTAALRTVASDGGRIRRWTLCIPSELDLEANRWWQDLKAGHPDLELELWDRGELSGRLMSPAGRDIHWTFFELEDPYASLRVAPPHTAATADPWDLGVAAAADLGELPVYVPREIESEIDAALNRHRFVVLDGDSAAGKSRALLEAVRRTLPEDVIVAPDPLDLRALEARIARVREPLHQRGLVLWLDDLDEYIGPAGLGPEALRRILRRGEAAHHALPNRHRRRAGSHRVADRLASRDELARHQRDAGRAALRRPAPQLGIRRGAGRRHGRSASWRRARQRVARRYPSA
jgi:hypothetical protein